MFVVPGTPGLLGQGTRIVSASYVSTLADERCLYSNLGANATHTLPQFVPYIGFTQYIERWDNSGFDLLIAPAAGDNFQQSGGTTNNSYRASAYGEVVSCRVVAITGSGVVTWAFNSNMNETFFANSGWIAIPANGTKVGARMMMGGKRSIKYAAVVVDAAVTSGTLTVQPAVNGVALGAGNQALTAGTSGIARQAMGAVLTNNAASPWELSIIVGNAAVVGPANMTMTVACW